MAAQARLSLHLSKCHIVGNNTSRLTFNRGQVVRIQISLMLQLKKKNKASSSGPTRLDIQSVFHTHRVRLSIEFWADCLKGANVMVKTVVGYYNKFLWTFANSVGLD